MATLAPASNPFSRPTGSIVPKAVVAGNRQVGSNNLINDSISVVSSTVPAGSFLNWVSWCGIKGPIPTICGSSSFKNSKSSAKISGVW